MKILWLIAINLWFIAINYKNICICVRSIYTLFMYVYVCLCVHGFSSTNLFAWKRPPLNVLDTESRFDTLGFSFSCCCCFFSVELMLFCYLSLHSSKGQEPKQQKVGWRECGDGAGGSGASGDMQAVEEGVSGRRDSLNQYRRSAGIWNGAQGQFKEQHIRLPIVSLT